MTSAELWRTSSLHGGPRRHRERSCQVAIAATLFGCLCLLFVVSLAGCSGTEQTDGTAAARRGGGDETRGPGDKPSDEEEPQDSTPAPLGRGTDCRASKLHTLQPDPELGATHPRLAASSDAIGVVVTQPKKVQNGTRAEVFFFQLDVEGRDLEHGPISLTPAGATADVARPAAIAALSDGFAVAWADNREISDGTDGPAPAGGDIYLARVDSNATISEAAPVTESGQATMPYLAGPRSLPGSDAAKADSLDRLALAWTDGRRWAQSSPGGAANGAKRDLYFRVLSVDAPAPGTPLVLFADRSRQHATRPVVVPAGENFFVSWADRFGTASRLFHAFASRSGSVAGAAVEVADNSGIKSSLVDAAGDGTRLSVVYTDNPSADTGQLHLIGVDGANRQLTARETLDVGGVPCSPAIADNGTHRAIVWQEDCSPGAGSTHLMFMLVDDKGRTLGPDGSPCTQAGCGIVDLTPTVSGYHFEPQVVAIQGGFAVAWMNRTLETAYVTSVNCAE